MYVPCSGDGSCCVVLGGGVCGEWSGAWNGGHEGGGAQNKETHHTFTDPPTNMNIPTHLFARGRLLHALERQNELVLGAGDEFEGGEAALRGDLAHLAHLQLGCFCGGFCGGIAL